MPTMVSTTLAAACGVADQNIRLTSYSGVYPPGPPNFTQTLLYCEREAMCVVIGGSNPVARVQRGYAGTLATAHPLGATVWVGPSTAFGTSDPSGTFSQPQGGYTPLVVIPTGNVWNDAGGVWALVGGGLGTITEITSEDESVTITNPTGPVVDLSVVGGGGTIQEITSTDNTLMVGGGSGPSTNLTFGSGITDAINDSLNTFGQTLALGTRAVVGSTISVTAITEDLTPEEGEPVMMLCDTSENAITITLPDPVSFPNYFIIKKINAANTVTIDGDGVLIDGASTVVLTNIYESVQIVASNTGNWFITARI